jgi:hypothetical protein
VKREKSFQLSVQTYSATPWCAITTIAHGRLYAGTEWRRPLPRD